MPRQRNQRDILREIEQHLPDIQRTGTLELRTEPGRTPVFCVRFRYLHPESGHIRQRRLTIGDDPEAQRIVRTAIQNRIIKRKESKQARLEARAARKKAQAERYGGLGRLIKSRRKSTIYERAKRYAKRYRLPLHGALVMVQLRGPPRGGRPLKCRLW